MKFPTLYYKDPKGNIRTWDLSVEGNSIITVYGLKGGAKQKSIKQATGKNVGKVNETTASAQAVLEAQSLWEHKRTRHYSETEEDAKRIPVVLPMKLQPYDKYGTKKIKFPCHVQPKLDGFRAMASVSTDTDDVIFTSRSGRVYNVPHLQQALRQCLTENPSVVLDGEFYLHGKITFQQLASLIKRNRRESAIVEYHVFDMVDMDDMTLPFHERIHRAARMVTEIKHPQVKFVDIGTVRSHEEIRQAHDYYYLEGYEGAVVRNYDGLYKFNYRSYDALKVKQFLDEEFTIVGHETGVGKFENCVIWVCETKDKKQFKAVPLGTQIERARMLSDAEKYYGKQVTVKFLNWTDDGVPRHPVAVRIRGLE